MTLNSIKQVLCNLKIDGVDRVDTDSEEKLRTQCHSFHMVIPEGGKEFPLSPQDILRKIIFELRLLRWEFRTFLSFQTEYDCVVLVRKPFSEQTIDDGHFEKNKRISTKRDSLDLISENTSSENALRSSSSSQLVPEIQVPRRYSERKLVLPKKVNLATSKSFNHRRKPPLQSTRSVDGLEKTLANKRSNKFGYGSVVPKVVISTRDATVMEISRLCGFPQYRGRIIFIKFCFPSTIEVIAEETPGWKISGMIRELWSLGCSGFVKRQIYAGLVGNSLFKFRINLTGSPLLSTDQNVHILLANSIILVTDALFTSHWHLEFVIKETEFRFYNSRPLEILGQFLKFS